MVCMMRFGDFPPCKKYGGGGGGGHPPSLTPTECFNISTIEPYLHNEKLGMLQFTSFRYVFNHMYKQQ